MAAVLHQPAHRRDGDLDPHGDRRRRRDGAAAGRAVSRTSRRPRSSCTATYAGADALTLEQSVATPIEQQMSGVDNMIYMYSINASSGSQMQLRVDFDVTTDPNTDQVLDQMRYAQAAVAAAARRGEPVGVTVKKSVDQPAGALRALLAEGHLRRALPRQLRLHQHQRPDDARAGRRPGADLRRRPVRDAALGQSRHAGEARHHRQRDRRARMQAQNTVNPAGQIGGEPVPPGPGVHLHGARAGPPGEPSRSSRTSWCAPSPTARWSG